MAIAKQTPDADDKRSLGNDSDQEGVRVATLNFVPRRRALAAGAAIGVGVGLHRVGASAAESPAGMRPQVGDLIVYRFGPHQGKPVKPADVPRGAELVQVFSKDPASGTVRDGSRLNGINLVWVKSDALNAELRKAAVDGVVAFSSVCTHQGCDLTQWHPDKSHFECFCHHSHFDVTKLGEPVHGPAQRSLAMLPLGTDASGNLVVAAKFQGKVGFKG